ncbi:hypothetical protein AHAS_Ahas20G0207000 [Arachis hypogaea]
MPHFFNRKNLAYWKERIRIFIQSIDYNIWKMVVNSPKIPTKTNANGVVTPKEEVEWNNDDKKNVELNAKAINLLYYAISFEEYQKVSRCKTAKESGRNSRSHTKAEHFKYNCPKLKKEGKGKKEKKIVLMASWEDLENDSDEEEDSKYEAQVCFMAGEDQLDEVNYYDLSMDDLHVIVDDLTHYSEKLLNKYNKYKIENEMLKAENNF